jgi:hypothetical protein
MSKTRGRSLVSWLLTATACAALGFACAGEGVPPPTGATDMSGGSTGGGAGATGSNPTPSGGSSGASSGSGGASGGGTAGSTGAGGSRGGSSGSAGSTGSGGSAGGSSGGGMAGSPGAAGRGGATGMGGSGSTLPPSDPNAPGCKDVIAMDNLVSDFEDGTNGIAAVSGRGGGWYAYNDGTGTQTPDPKGSFLPEKGGACASMYALKTAGSGSTKWGAGVGTDLAVSIAGKKVVYDASMYSAVRFMARAGSATTVRFKVQDKNTVPEGMICKVGMCDDNFGKELMVTTGWQVYTVKFTEMMQEGWGQKFPTLEKNNLYGIQFQFKMGASFELWVDNLAFVK